MLIVFKTREYGRKGLVLSGCAAQLLLHIKDDGGTVEAAAQACSNGYIASQSL